MTRAENEALRQRAQAFADHMDAIYNPQTPQDRAIRRDHLARVEGNELILRQALGMAPFHPLYRENRDFYTKHPQRQGGLDLNISLK